MILLAFLWALFAIAVTSLVRSFARERSLYRNAVLLGVSLIGFLIALIMTSAVVGLGPSVLFLLFVGTAVGVFAVSIVFVRAGVITLRREGLSLPNSLALLYVVGVWALMAIAVLLFSIEPVNHQATTIGWMLVAFDAYFVFTFVSLFLYSQLYCLVPSKRDVDYIIVLGAGLIGDQPTPLLRSRLDTAYRTWHVQGRRPKIVTSGGQGSDEVVSEAQAMANYLIGLGVPEDQVLLENRSTNTLENMTFSKRVIANDCRGAKVRCVFVTNDFHVFRAATYAREAGLVAEGVACHTVSWYWAGAFVREYIAIMIKHWEAPVIVGILWLVAALVS